MFKPSRSHDQYGHHAHIYMVHAGLFLCLKHSMQYGNGYPEFHAKQLFSVKILKIGTP